MKKALLFLTTMCGAMFLAAQPFTPVYLPGTWPTNLWWTNASYPTNISGSNAWAAVNEMGKRASNAFRLVTEWGVAFGTNTPPASTNYAAWLVITNRAGSNYALPACLWP